MAQEQLEIATVFPAQSTIICFHIEEIEKEQEQVSYCINPVLPNVPAWPGDEIMRYVHFQARG